MKILVCGGGSGGHITPVLAVLEELYKKDPRLEVCFVCDKKFAPQARTILEQSNVPITFKTINAGKLRRYHGVPLIKQLADVPTVAKNVRDVFLVGAGYTQSLAILRKFRPDVVFTKGGFVCLPMGLAASQLRIPLVIHDSDTLPGLTNRVLAPRAKYIATGAPLENYDYDTAKTTYVGIPISSLFYTTSASQRAELKKEVTTDPSRILVFVTGGGLGAQRVNDAVVRSAKKLIKEHCEIIHISGVVNEKDVRKGLESSLSGDDLKYYHLVPFASNTDMARYLKAADIVVSRSGATALTEIAALGKPTILIPNPQLAGGHQLKNTQIYSDADAAVVVDETELERRPELLASEILKLARDAQTRLKLGEKMHKFAMPNAAADVVALLVKAAG